MLESTRKRLKDCGLNLGDAGDGHQVGRRTRKRRDQGRVPRIRSRSQGVKSVKCDRFSRPKLGFTLVELLVVIFIIGILIALLLPAVQAAREAARRATCQSNLKQIGISLLNYHDAHSAFPPFFIGGIGDHKRIADVDKGANWLVMLLPYLEQKAIHDQWDFNIPANQNPGRSAELAAFKCPSDGYNAGNLCTYAGGGWARGNYGMNVAPCSYNFPSKVTGAPSPLGGIGGANFSVGIRQITDGTSNTVAVDEIRAGLNPDDLRGCWAMPGLGSGTSALFRDAHVPNARGGHSDDMENCRETGFEGDRSQGMGCYDPGGPTNQMAARSMHPGGVHALMVGGSVRFATDGIEGNSTRYGSPAQGVWQVFHTRGGGEIAGEF